MDIDELVGRDDVLAALSDAVARIDDHGDALLLLGEAGIGRTTCLLAAESMARAAGHLVLATGGVEAETKLPYAGLHRLLLPLVASTDTLPDVQRRALLTAVGLHEGADSDRLLVSVATVNLLREASTHRPLVITADDLQWLDLQTRHVLAFLTRRLDRRVVVIAASSSLDGLPELRDVFRDLRLARLDEPSAHRVLATRAPALDAAHREWVVGQAVGNPLTLVELTKIAASVDLTRLDPVGPVPSLTPPLRRAFAGRLHELPKSGRDVALVAAVASDASLPEILAATALLSGHRVTATVLEAPQALGLLRFDETRVHFTHSLVKVAIAQREPVSRRQAAHRALGAVITVNSRRRAWHRALGTAAHDDAIAAELEATTSDNAKRGDTVADIMALERAAQLSTAPVERGRRLIVAARLAGRLGQPEVFLRLLNAATGGELTDSDRVRAEVLREDFDGVVIADSARVIQLCGAARHAVAAGETDLALELVQAAGRQRCAAPVSARARAEVASVAGRLVRDSSDARAVAALALADPVGHGRAVLSMLADMDDETVLDADTLSAYAVAARAAGDYATAARLLGRAELEYRARGLLGPLARNLCIVADLCLDLGEWERAAAASAEFATLSAAAMSPTHRAAALTTTAKAAALRGDTSIALDLVAQTEHSPVARSGSSYLARAQIVRGIAYLSAGRHLDAYAALTRAFEPDDPSHHFREQFGAVGYLAEAAVRTDGQHQARDVIARMQLVAQTCGSPILMAHLSYAEAVLAPDEEAERLFLHSLASEAAGSPWSRARVQLAYGRWLRRQLRVTQSRVPLQDALAVLRRLGAARWTQEALDELEAAGAPGRETPDGAVLGLLTGQELRIARLVAEGLSNREIAQRLFLSPRTISSHLYRIFPKLKISTRGQVAARLNLEDEPIGTV